MKYECPSSCFLSLFFFDMCYDILSPTAIGMGTDSKGLSAQITFFSHPSNKSIPECCANDSSESEPYCRSAMSFNGKLASHPGLMMMWTHIFHVDAQSLSFSLIEKVLCGTLIVKLLIQLVKPENFQPLTTLSSDVPDVRIQTVLEAGNRQTVTVTHLIPASLFLTFTTKMRFVPHRSAPLT